MHVHFSINPYVLYCFFLPSENKFFVLKMFEKRKENANFCHFKRPDSNLPASRKARKLNIIEALLSVCSSDNGKVWNEF